MVLIYFEFLMSEASRFIGDTMAPDQWLTGLVSTTTAKFTCSTVVTSRVPRRAQFSAKYLLYSCVLHRGDGIGCPSLAGYLVPGEGRSKIAYNEHK